MAQTITLSENTLLKLLIRRGSNEERKLVIPSKGELIYTVDSRRVFVGDGTTLGGYVVGNKFYGSGTDVINPTIPQTASITNGFAFYGDSYFNTANSSYYVLTGTNVSNLSSWQMVGNITTGNNTTTVRNNDGTISLLPLSAGSFDPKTFTGGLTSNGTYISLGPTIQTNTIVPLNGSTLTLSAAGNHFIKISDSVLQFAPSATVALELPALAKFGTAEVNFDQTTWNDSVGYVYKDNNTIKTTPTLGSGITFLSTPIDVLDQLKYSTPLELGSFGLSTFNIDFTTSGPSTVVGLSTLSGVPAAGALLFVGQIASTTASFPYTNTTRITVNTDANNGNSTPITLNAYQFDRVANSDWISTFSFFAPLSAATTSTNSVGTMTLVISASGSQTPGFQFMYLKVIAVL